MPYLIRKEGDKFRLLNTKTGLYTATKFKSEISAMNAAQNYMRFGGGIVDDVLKATKGMPVGDIAHKLGILGKQRYPEEAHMTIKGKTANFAGPGTRLDLRLDENDNPLPDSMPVDELDWLAYHHDLAYKYHQDLKSRNIADLALLKGATKLPLTVETSQVIGAMYAKLLLENPGLMKT